MDRQPVRISHAQAALIETCTQLACLFGTPGRLPMPAAFILCTFYFRAPPINVLRELARAKFVSFDGTDGECVILATPRKEQILADTPRPMSLPRGDESLRMLRAEFARVPHTRWPNITKLVLGRPNAGQDALPDENVIPIRKPVMRVTRTTGT